MSAVIVARLLANPASAQTLRLNCWTGVICAARAERLLASLAHRLAGLDLPTQVVDIFDSVRADAEVQRTAALWEAEMARRALAHLEVPVVLLKGTAFLAAGLDAGQGRLVGDLDILVPRDRLDAVETALLAAGWEWVKPDAYDDMYYRRWMHELPPLIHRTRDRMIDVHHTILPLTARPKPLPALLIELSEPLENGLRVLLPEHMIVHAAAHLLADGDMSGGLRNLWDIDRMCRQFAEQQDDFYLSVVEEASFNGLYAEVMQALRLSHQIFGTPVKPYDRPIKTRFAAKRQDARFRARLLARDGWGRPTRPLLRFAFYVRSHLIRMPLPILLRHLWKKWRKTG